MLGTEVFFFFFEVLGSECVKRDSMVAVKEIGTERF